MIPGIAAVFLDRDGILNRPIVRDGRPYPPASLDEVEILPGVVHSLQQLASAGYLLIGVTNQPDVVRAAQTREAVEAINSHILSELPVTEIFTCFHDNQDNCLCRKPKPGLILQGANKYGVDLMKSWMVGDRWKDISAGQAVGLRTVFVNYNYNETYSGPFADFIIEDLTSLAEIILHS